jgi:hypothetical protein
MHCERNTALARVALNVVTQGESPEPNGSPAGRVRYSGPFGRRPDTAQFVAADDPLVK